MVRVTFSTVNKYSSPQRDFTYALLVPTHEGSIGTAVALSDTMRSACWAGVWHPWGKEGRLAQVMMQSVSQRRGVGGGVGAALADGAVQLTVLREAG